MLCNGYEMDNLWTQNNRRTPTIARYVLRMVAYYSNEDRSNYIVHSLIPLVPSTSTCTLTNFILDSRLFFPAWPHTSPFHSSSTSPDNPGGISISTDVSQPDT